MGMRPVVLVCLTWVTACANYHAAGPEEWWHESVGGAISRERPPPPGDKDPYPNLATVPAKPAKADAAVWNQITAGLITDRVNAREAAALAPIPAPSPETPAPPSPGVGPLETGHSQTQEPGASAALVGASPRAATPGKASPVQPANSAANFPEGSVTGPPAVNASTSGEASSAAPPTLANAAQRVANGQLPALPTQEPPRPDIAPGPPPPLTPITAVPPAAMSPVAGGDLVDFDRGSAALLDAALREVKALAEIRGDRGVAITGYGDATTSDAIGQSEALGLGLSRAQALATALVAQGVPFARLRLNAESAGRGASLRLLQ